MPETFGTDVMLLIAFMGAFALLLSTCELIQIGFQKVRKILFFVFMNTFALFLLACEFVHTGFQKVRK